MRTTHQNRTIHYGYTQQCCGVTAKGTRCKRDVTHQLGDKAYCGVHFNKAIEEKK